MKTLTNEFDTLAATLAGGVWSIDSPSGWRQPTPGQNFFINSSYIDLAGMSMEDKTLFFQGAAIQEVYNPSFTPATLGDTVALADIMTQVPLTDGEVALFLSGGNIAGFNGSPLTFDQTVYGRIRLYNIDVDNQASRYPILLSDNQLGSLSPTASDRVYCYRALLVGMAVDGTFVLPPARYLLRAEAKEEQEYQYLMRLKRSYELQNDPDRD